MIRISSGPIELGLSNYQDDFLGSQWYFAVSPWGYVGFEEFKKILWFERRYEGVMALKQTEEKLKFSNSSLYQFNASPTRVPTWDKYIRFVAVMDNPDPVNRITAVGLFDAFVKYPVYKAIASVGNRIFRFLGK